MLSRLEALRGIAILKSLDDGVLAALERRLEWRTVSAGDEVVSHLAPEADVYFVLEGSFRVSLTSPGGLHVSLRLLEAGSHFGEIAALTGSPRTASVTAETAGVVARCPPSHFLEIMRSEAEFAAVLAAALARTVLLLSDRVFEMSALEARFRIYSELLRLAAHGVESSDGIIISNVPTHEMIAAAVGAQREVVTRELRHLVREGVLKQQRREIVLLKPERLRTMVESRAGVTASQIFAWPT